MDGFGSQGEYMRVKVCRVQAVGVSIVVVRFGSVRSGAAVEARIGGQRSVYLRQSWSARVS